MDSKLAVVIPTYNRLELTIRAIESVRSAQPERVEIIVVDDASTPPFHYAAPRNRCGIPVRVLRCEQNAGSGVARAAGVSYADAALVSFLDSDDVYTADWCDEVLARCVDRFFLGGAVENGSPVHALWHRLVAALPRRLQRFAVRLTFIFFNPFYTPAVAVGRSICGFDASLRYCEDYLANASAAFRATTIIVLPKVACVLSRAPGSSGGLSSMSSEMFRGELAARRALMHSKDVPFGYKLLMPLGYAYQFARTLLKALFRPRVQR